MSKAIMLSIRPKWCEKIASGEKTIEVRKTRPKLPTPFKCYIYCTLPTYPHEDFIATNYPTPQFYGGGKVVGEFTCDRIDRLAPANEPYGIYDIDDDYVLQTCLENGALWDYGHGTPLFGWNISDLKIYDKPRELREFKKSNRDCFYADLGLAKRDCPDCKNSGCFLERPPQSWCYVEAIQDG